jgi:hypothetical protein
MERYYRDEYARAMHEKLQKLIDQEGELLNGRYTIGYLNPYDCDCCHQSILAILAKQHAAMVACACLVWHGPRNQLPTCEQWNTSAQGEVRKNFNRQTRFLYND